MKLKDLEKKLKKEHEQIRVPDVYSRAKLAPINSLLTGETPAQAFKKHLAIRLLFLVMVLLAVSLIALTAYGMNKNKSRGLVVSDAYCSVTVTNNGESVRYGLVFDSTKAVKFVVNESDQTVISGDGNITLINAISALYDTKSGDKVVVVTQSDVVTYASEIAVIVCGEVSARYEDGDIKSVTSEVADVADRLITVNFVNGVLGEDKVTVNDSLAAISYNYALAVQRLIA